MPNGKRKSKSTKRGGKLGVSEGSGTTISGHQIYVTVQNGAAGTKLFNSNNAIPLSPDSMGTQIALLANQYNQYRFKKIDIEYKSTSYNIFQGWNDFSSGVPNAYSANLFAFGYEEDGALTFTVTHSAISQLHDNMILPTSGYKARGSNILHVRRLGPKWYYCKDNSTTNADLRQTIQGLIYGEALNTITDSTQWGELVIHYVVQFKDACPTQGVTLSTMMREVALGKTAQLSFMLKAVQHAAKFYECEGRVDQSVLDTYTNEEYLAFMGTPRLLNSCKREERSPTDDTYELVDRLTALAARLKA